MALGLGLGFGAQLLVGLVAMFILVFGAEKVVDKMTSIAHYYSIPDVVIAMSVISVGTSLPEIIAHGIASFRILAHDECPEVFANAVSEGTLHGCAIDSAAVLGANIGSDVVQQTLIVGLVILAFIVIRVRRAAALQGGITNNLTNTYKVINDTYFTFDVSFLKKDYFPMVGTTLMCVVLGWDGIYSRLDGLVLVGSFFAYMYYLYKTREDRMTSDEDASDNVMRDSLIVVIAFASVLASAHIILEVTQILVQKTGLGGSLIGVATLGIISALPELMTAIQGLRHEAEGISLGTLIGSNITNPLLAIGGGALVSTYWVPRPLVLWDLPMETITAGLLLFYLLFISDRKLGWKGGLYLVGLYIFYLGMRAIFFSADTAGIAG
jgi:cation:H+ antiporter